MPNAQNNCSRRPEESARDAYRARLLHLDVQRRPAIAAGAHWSAAVARDALLSGLDPATQALLFDALASAPDDATRSAIICFARSSTFVSLPRATRRGFFRALARGRSGRAWLDELSALARLLQFQRLGEAVQVAVLRRLDEAASQNDEATRNGFVAVASSPGFGALRPEEQLELLRWFAGPETGAMARLRKNRLEAAWNARRRELLQLLKSACREGCDALLEAARIREFLHQPSRALHFLDATDLTGHAVVVFGDPRDAGAWCYGRRWHRAQNRARVAKLSCPDPTVQLGWKERRIDALSTYVAKKLMISRAAERALISFIERSYTMSDDLRLGASLGPAAVSGRAERFSEETLAAALRLIAGSGAPAPTRGYMRAGRPVNVAAA